MNGLTLVAILAAPLGIAAGVAVIAYLLGFDNGYLRARRELRETSARRPRRNTSKLEPILGVTRLIKRRDEAPR